VINVPNSKPQQKTSSSILTPIQPMQANNNDKLMNTLDAPLNNQTGDNPHFESQGSQINEMLTHQYYNNRANNELANS
jgi:hypothetical protein